MRNHQLNDDEELDQICWNEYGDLPGAVEAVLKTNWDRLHLFDGLGRVLPLTRPEFITLPDLKRPTETTRTVRIFD
ncbi:MAG TPA: tail protein X [Oligoflexus sp.]|uniref:tail protein X n=1 Tax=Oligoflexus sp. TaxID=1971216 RepID=UPI002D5BCE3A|nr:tail protein X [Oligoflexus sp.]HYX32204.1 tail protein X [Oligoflexus sp.]